MIFSILYILKKHYILLVVDTFIGNVQLKEADTVNFFAQKNTSFSNADNTIPFDTAILNVGNAMNTATGVFTAPVAGIYHFEFSGMTSEKLNVILKKNGDDIASTAADFSFWNGNSFYSGISLACSLQLSANDNVSLYLFGPGSLYQNDTVAVPNTHFTGWLVTADAAVLPQGP